MSQNALATKGWRESINCLPRWQNQRHTVSRCIFSAE